MIRWYVWSFGLSCGLLVMPQIYPNLIEKIEKWYEDVMKQPLVNANLSTWRLNKVDKYEGKIAALFSLKQVQLIVWLLGGLSDREAEKRSFWRESRARMIIHDTISNLSKLCCYSWLFWFLDVIRICFVVIGCHPISLGWMCLLIFWARCFWMRTYTLHRLHGIGTVPWMDVFLEISWVIRSALI